MNLVLTPQNLISPALANNLLGEFANFNKPYAYVVTAGSGTATNTAISGNQLFGYLTMSATPTSTSLLKWKAIGSEFEKTITEMESLVPNGPSFSHFADCVILLYNHQI